MRAKRYLPLRGAIEVSNLAFLNFDASKVTPYNPQEDHSRAPKQHTREITAADIPAVAAAVLPFASSLIREWFPNAKRQGGEWTIGSIYGEPGASFSINERTGCWGEFNGKGETGGDFVSLYATKFQVSNFDAARELKQKFGLTTGELHTAVHAPKPAEEWLPMMPVPEGAGSPPMRGTVHTYRDAAGRVLFYVERTEATASTPKTFRPWTYGTLGGVTGWHRRHPHAPRPLYLLDQMAARPDAPVVICEGEKACDAAAALLPDYVAVSWPAGANSVCKADWTPLLGREVTVWPDNDAAGLKAAAEIAAKLPGARTIEVSDLPEGADAADLDPAEGAAWFEARLASAEAVKAETGGELLDFLDVHTWIDLDIPPVKRFLGDMLTTGSRVFIVGGTGLGKTQLAHAMGAGIASGRGFLHWQCDAPARVLVIDGEMSTALIKSHMRAALDRGGDVPRGNLILFALDRAEVFATRFPDLGNFEPLNTPAGREFALRLIDFTAPEVVIFDNVMSLVSGDQKDEVPWSETLPLVQAITGRGLGQVWLDHTGHDRSRQYGSSTKAWRFDAVGIMTQAEAENDGEVAFQLSFDSPGKARNRSPENWGDFAPSIMKLGEAGWSSEPADKNGKAEGGLRRVLPAVACWFDALLDALCVSAQPGQASKEEWWREGVRKGLSEDVAETDTRTVKEAKRVKFRKAVSALVEAGWIGVNGDTVRDLTEGKRP